MAYKMPWIKEICLMQGRKVHGSQESLCLPWINNNTTYFWWKFTHFKTVWSKKWCWPVHLYIIQERRNHLSFIYYSVNIIQENWNTNKKVIRYFFLSIIFIFEFQVMQYFKKCVLGIFCWISSFLSCDRFHVVSTWGIHDVFIGITFKKH